MSGRDDRSLIEACKSGESEAFGILVQRYQDRIYPTLLRLTGCAEDALDLLQEAFLRSYQKLAWFHGESSFYTWVYRIAVNLALSDRRKSKRRAAVRATSLDHAMEVGDDPERTDPSLSLERAELEKRVQAARSTGCPPISGRWSS